MMFFFVITTVCRVRYHWYPDGLCWSTDSILNIQIYFTVVTFQIWKSTNNNHNHKKNKYLVQLSTKAFINILLVDLKNWFPFIKHCIHNSSQRVHITGCLTAHRENIFWRQILRIWKTQGWQVWIPFLTRELWLQEKYEKRDKVHLSRIFKDHFQKEIQAVKNN